MAQLVEHHLAKVRVAGSNPVVRSRSEAPVTGGFRRFPDVGRPPPLEVIHQCTSLRFIAGLDGIMSFPEESASPMRESTAILVSTEMNHGDTGRVWFWDLAASRRKSFCGQVGE